MACASQANGGLEIRGIDIHDNAYVRQCCNGIYVPTGKLVNGFPRYMMSFFDRNFDGSGETKKRSLYHDPRIRQWRANDTDAFRYMYGVQGQVPLGTSTWKVVDNCASYRTTSIPTLDVQVTVREVISYKYCEPCPKCGSLLRGRGDILTLSNESRKFS